MMRLTTLSLVLSLITAQAAASSLTDTDGSLLTRSYVMRLVATRNDILNGAYYEGAHVFERRDCGGNPMPW